jgi:hypothetical protein
MAQDRTVKDVGFQLKIASGSVTKKVQAAVLEGLVAVTENYKKQILQNISLTDHDLKELRALGYPYALGKPENSLHDDREVHIQTGRLKSGIKSEQPQQLTSRKFSVIITSSAPETPHLLYGTKFMRPRRFHMKAFEQTKDKFWQPVLDLLKKVKHNIPPLR